MLEEWKKLWKKKIIQSKKIYFLSFPKLFGRMEEARQKIQKTWQKLLEEWKKLWIKKIIQS